MIVERDWREFLVMILAKVVDQFHLAGRTVAQNLFCKVISQRFPIGWLTLKNDIVLYCLPIFRSKNSLTLLT